MAMDESFTIDEFCEAEKFSRAHYFNLRNRGEGPREYRAGRCVRITAEARADWRRERETA